MGFHQLTLGRENSKHICQPIAGLLMLPDELTRRFGIQFVDEDLQDGLGPAKAALIETFSRRRFGLVHYLFHPEPKGTSVWAHEHSSDPVADLQDFVEALNLSRSDFIGGYF